MHEPKSTRPETPDALQSANAPIAFDVRGNRRHFEGREAPDPFRDTANGRRLHDALVRAGLELAADYDALHRDMRARFEQAALEYEQGITIPFPKPPSK